MQIIHRIDAFFYTLFPQIKDESEIVEVLQNFYSIDGYRPTVKIDDNMVFIDIDTEALKNFKAELATIVALCEKGHFDAAKPQLLKLIEANPTSSELHRILGQILSEEGEQDEAINALIDALRWDSSNGWALTMMGNIFARYKNDISTALKYYDQAILVNKADHISLANTAYLLLQENRLSHAKKYANAALKLNDNYPNTSFILSLIAEKEDDLNSAFLYSIAALKQSTNEGALYENAVKQAFSIAERITSDSNNIKTHQAYRSQLEAEGGIEIDIIEDDTIPVAAKIEFAERHNRENHLVKYKTTYPAVEHLLMHELVHLDFVLQARKENLNQVFSSTHHNKQEFLKTIQSTIKALEKMGVEKSMITQFTDGVFNGLNLQVYNTPIDVFIEDFLYKKYEALRPYQFLSLYSLLQDGIAAVTNKVILDTVPPEIISKTKTLTLVNALQFHELFGMNLISDFKASNSELQQAKNFYSEFSKLKDSRSPGQEFELVKNWGQVLGQDQFFELESETKFESKSNIDDFLTKLQNDPFGLEEPEDLLQKKEMEQFQKHQQEIGTNMAIVMFMVDALKFFKDKKAEEIKNTAFEIAMLGTMGIDPNKKDYIVSSIPKKRFSGNQILAYYYTSWSLAMPHAVAELGLDFKKEFEIARNLSK